MALIECVPNFSEGRDPKIIHAITTEIQQVKGVKILHIDRGYSANRTVITFFGEPQVVIQGAFQAIKKAAEIIDMNIHEGTHPCIGATDVCPLIPLSGITMKETIKWAYELGQKVSQELKIPVYLYEKAASKKERSNLAHIRKGGFKKLEQKLSQKEWIPDFGHPPFHPNAGATIIGVRDFLLAYNINLNTNNVKVAKEIAAAVRSSGNPKALPHLKAIGWSLPEKDIAQVSLNLTNVKVTGFHQAYENVKKEAEKRGYRVTGSELIGLTPEECLIDAGKFYNKKEHKSTKTEQNNAILIKQAIAALGLSDLEIFKPEKRILEYLMNKNDDIE